MKNKARSQTVICVVKDKNGKLVMGGDRRLSFGNNFYQESPVPKIFKRNGVLLSGSGVMYVCDEIIRLAHIPVYTGLTSVYDHMQLAVLPEILSHLRQRELLHPTQRKLLGEETGSEEDDSSAGILLGLRGTLFCMGISTSSISIDEVATPFTDGCGGVYAMGSLLTTGGSKMSAEKRIRLAIEVAAKCSSGCDNNVDILYED